MWIDVFICYQDRKTKNWVSWWVGFLCLITSEMYLQEALKTTGKTNKPEPHHEFAYVRIVKSLPSKQGNGQRTQMSWFSTLLTPTPGILFFTRFPCASPEFLQHFAISNSGTSWTDCWGIDQKVSKLLSATQWKTFFFFFSNWIKERSENQQSNCKGSNRSTCFVSVGGNLW